MRLSEQKPTQRRQNGKKEALVFTTKQADKTTKEEKLAGRKRVKGALLSFSAQPCGAICTAGNGSVIPLFTGIGADLAVAMATR